MAQFLRVSWWVILAFSHVYIYIYNPKYFNSQDQSTLFTMGFSHVFSNLTAGLSSPRPLASPGIPWAQSGHPSLWTSRPRRFSLRILAFSSGDKSSSKTVFSSGAFNSLPWRRRTSFNRWAVEVRSFLFLDVVQNGKCLEMGRKYYMEIPIIVELVDFFLMFDVFLLVTPPEFPSGWSCCQASACSPRQAEHPQKGQKQEGFVRAWATYGDFNQDNMRIFTGM